MIIRSVAVLACAKLALAQCPQYTPAFHGGGFDDQVEDLLRFDDGAGAKLYAGGRFNGAGAVAAAHVAVWDGAQWSALGAGLDGPVNALEGHDDGGGAKLYAGGAFANSGASPANRVARWDGASWSALGAGLSGGPVLTLKSFDDGSGAALYAGGGFTSSGGASTSRVARWNGASWSQVGNGLNGTVRALAVHDDGSGPSLFAARDGGARVARWSGTDWLGVGAALGSDAILRAMVSYDAGPGQRWLVVGGERLLGTDCGVAVWDGASWSSLLTLTSSPSVQDLVVRQEGADLALYACGGVQGGVVQRWTPAAGWGAMAQASSNGVPLSLAFHDDGTGGGDQLYTAGQFVWLRPFSAPWLDAQRIARFSTGAWRQVMAPAAASLTPPIAVGLTGDFDDPEVYSLARWLDPRDGRAKLAASGHVFAPSSAPQALGLALWDGVAWSALPSSPISGAFIDTITSWFDPSVGAEVLVASAELPNSVWKFDGSSWSRLGTNGPKQVRAFASYQAPGAASAELYAAPYYPTSPDIWRVTRWDGSTWHDVPGLTDPIAELLVFDPPGPLGEELYALGRPPTPAHRWNGTQWSALPTTGLPAGTEFFSGAVFDAGAGPELFAGGYGALYRFDGAAWTSYPVGAPFAAWDLEAFDDGSGPALYMGAGQRFRNGQVETYAAGGPTSPFLTEPFDLEAFEDESGGSRALFICGDFDFVGIPSRGLARWSNPCGALRSYCTAKVNSLGCTPSIGWSGEPSVSLVASTPFVVTAANVLNQRPGLLYYGVFGAAATPFQGGVQCVNAPVRRTPLRSSGGNTSGSNCSGLYSIDFSSWVDGTRDPLVSIGTTVRAQWWSRDPASPSGTGLSNALELEVRP